MEPKKEHKCLRCGYTWRSAKEDKDIKACCYCKSYKWRIKKEEVEK
jgi:predicted  nucleic acid-binding Zn-ribbon protein